MTRPATAVAVAAVRHSDRRRRIGHRHRRGARPRRLGARHRPEPADRRRGDVDQVQPAAGAGSTQLPGAPRAAQDDMGRFVSKVLGSTDAAVEERFRQGRQELSRTGAGALPRPTHAQCGGVAQAAMGPFYCPADQKIYLDTSFFEQIATRFRGCDVGSKSCQFSQAYVIAHEVGHHVQNLLGILPKAQQAQRAAHNKASGCQPHPGAGRAAGRLLRRRVGEARE